MKRVVRKGLLTAVWSKKGKNKYKYLTRNPSKFQFYVEIKKRSASRLIFIEQLNLILKPSFDLWMEI